MAYSSDILNKKIYYRVGGMQDGEYGRVAKAWVEHGPIWANVTWSKGAKAMREGVMDAYDSIMVRTRWRSTLTRDCRLRIGDKVYEIDSFNGSYEDDEIQITAREIQE